MVRFFKRILLVYLIRLFLFGVFAYIEGNNMADGSTFLLIFNHQLVNIIKGTDGGNNLWQTEGKKESSTPERG